jgi:hypothetical protein
MTWREKAVPQQADTSLHIPGVSLDEWDIAQLFFYIRREYI